MGPGHGVEVGDVCQVDARAHHIGSARSGFTQRIDYPVKDFGCLFSGVAPSDRAVWGTRGSTRDEDEWACAYCA
ncbi:hypothetical protein GCM10022252_16960 [Streptosporangium oxazolinicum]|uniref:Uncharacterized protein n=1 Tax=Streptosporangium oxazolinicum TaxID=909287 RepID=A0ABP8ALB0_9ACTN